MAFQLQWSIEGEKELSRRLRNLSAATTKLKPAFNDSAEMLKGFFSEEVFASEGQIIGEKWKRLSPVTIAQKARKGYPPTPLVSTGKMRESFKAEVDDDHATIYNATEYFKYHQSKLPRSRLPRRVMMKLDQKRKEMIVKIFQLFLRKQVQKP